MEGSWLSRVFSECKSSVMVSYNYQLDTPSTPRTTWKESLSEDFVYIE